MAQRVSVNGYAAWKRECHGVNNEKTTLIGASRQINE